MSLNRWRYFNSEKRYVSKNLLENIIDIRTLDIKNKGEFFHPIFTRKKAYLFKDCVNASKLIKQWIKEDKKIIIFGDYDVDGTCASAILLKTFDYLNYRNIDYHIPDRFSEGYGINPKSLEKLMQKNPEAIISVDCGINSNEEVKFLKEQGVKVLITDHHSLPDELPNADFILNPKLYTEQLDFYELCGAGIAFYLALHILPEDFDFSQLIQLAGLATVADLVPLSGDNRLLVNTAIEEIKINPLPSLEELIKLSSMEINRINAGLIAFRIAPAINAAGRLKHASYALNFLRSIDANDVKNHAETLFSLNNKRKELQSVIVNEAIEMIESKPELMANGVIMVYSEFWHEGLIGIAASNIVEIYNRPTIVFSLKDGVLKGSARSISGFSIYEAISSARDFVIRFGGHHAASGLSLDIENYEDFKNAIKQFCKLNLDSDLLNPSIKIDLDIDACLINKDSIYEIKTLEPYGIGNPKPIFALKDVSISSYRYIGKNCDTLKLAIEKDFLTFDAIAFRIKDRVNYEKKYRVDLAFNIDENVYNGISKTQLLLKDLRYYNPEIFGIQRLAFSFYVLKFIENLSKNSSQISKADTKICVSSYDDLLSEIFAKYDEGLNLKKLLKQEYLNSIIEIEFLTINDFKQMHSDGFMDYFFVQLDFNYKYARGVFQYLEGAKKKTLIEVLYLSKFPLTTMICIELFKENDLITIFEEKIIIKNKYVDFPDYNQSEVKMRIDNFLANL